MISGLHKAVVTEVDAVNQTVAGTTAEGGIFQASYYSGSPIVGEIVFIEQTADGSWLVITGPSSSEASFGVGGDGEIRLTASSTGAAARTTSADGACAIQSTTVTSASGAFTSADYGSVITSTSFSIGRTIVAVNSSTSVTVNHPLWASGAMSGEALTITPPIPYTVSGSTVTLQRNLYCTNLILDNSAGAVTLNANGYGIFCNQLLYVADGCVIHHDGSAASGATAGAGAVAKIYGGGGAGATGKSSAGAGAGATAANITGSIATTSAVAVVSGGGGGPAASTGTPIFYSPPSTIINAFANGWPASTPQAVTLLLAGSSTKFQGGSGGSGGAFGGSGGGGSGTGNGGGGGGGGGVLLVAARTIINFGTIRANGGAGAVGTASSVNSGAGGGGGGGGGAVVLIYGAAGSNLGAVYALGGAAGGGSSGGSSGGVGVTQYVDTIDYSEGFPRRIRQAVTVQAGGAGGAAGTNGTGVAANGQAGQSGLVWAIPL